MPAGPSPAGIGALPAHFEFSAPPAWRAIDFISDLHLCAAMPRTFAAWATHLRRTPADAVFMLGDLFEVWVGDDAREGAFERSAVEVMAEAASHRQLALMVGNRDFLLGHAMLRASGLIGLPDPTLLAAWGQRVLLSHGDALCLDDEPYQAWRRQVRADSWQAAFLARPLAERRQLAAEMRRASAARQRFDGQAGVDADAAEAVRWLHASGAAELVHGHTHRPASHALAPGFKRHVLSDWDLDDAARPRAEVLRLTRGGFQRLPPAGS
ncbi:MAG: UDP-2,3-diacylglucosamine diphosphatase [Burkholderiales bacterium]|nr:UDP-2,3-diacylglucosamine diphosphatase [Burkholderiales bacterium]